jgi:hypothetical protein
MMLVTLIYAWHIAALLTFQSLLGFLVWVRVQSLEGPGPAYQLVETRPETEGGRKENGFSKTNGHVPLGYPDRLQHLIDSESEEA